LEKIFKKLREKNNGFDIGYPKIYHKLGGKWGTQHWKKVFNMPQNVVHCLAKRNGTAIKKTVRANA
jgi:hypothetical protein